VSVGAGLSPCPVFLELDVVKLFAFADVDGVQGVPCINQFPGKAGCGRGVDAVALAVDVPHVPVMGRAVDVTDVQGIHVRFPFHI